MEIKQNNQNQKYNHCAVIPSSTVIIRPLFIHIPFHSQTQAGSHETPNIPVSV